MKRKQSSELIDDLSDIDGASNLYDLCVQKKIKGASNTELRELLQKHGHKPEEIRVIIRKIDSDYMDGHLKDPLRITKALTLIVIVLFELAAIGFLAWEMYVGIIMVWPSFIAVGFVSAGMGYLGKNYLIKKS